MKQLLNKWQTRIKELKIEQKLLLAEQRDPDRCRVIGVQIQVYQQCLRELREAGE